MRLYDRINAIVHFPDMPVIIADEIARQLDDVPIESLNYNYPLDWFEIIAPPFNQFWVEARTFEQGVQIERGMLFAVIPDESLLSKQFRNRLPDAKEARWLLRADAFYWNNNQGVCAFNTFAVVAIGHDSKILKVGKVDGYEDYIPQVPTTEWIEIFGINRIGHGIWDNNFSPVANISGLCLKAINAMHRRVEVSEVTPTRQMSRLSERKYGVKLSKYYLLKVKPYEPKSVEDFKRIGNPDKKDSRREHEVRGHFRYYHPDKPLFGRAGLTGMIWVPDHMRGNHELGTVDKGYKVVA